MTGVPDHHTASGRFRYHFRRLLYEQGRNQSEVAKKADLGSGWATKVKQGRHDPSLETVTKVAAVLKVDVSEFFLPIEQSKGSDLARHALRDILPANPQRGADVASDRKDSEVVKIADRVDQIEAAIQRLETRKPAANRRRVRPRARR